MKKFKARRAFAGLLAFVTVSVPLAAAPAMAQDALKVGAINPYSGAVAIYGDEVTRGYELAAEEINAAGGLLGRPVEILRGNATNPQEAIAAVDQLANLDGAELFVGTFMSSVSAAGSETALQYGKLYWDTNAVAANLTERGIPNFIRSGPFAGTFAQQSIDAVTGLVAKELGKEPTALKVWITHEDSVYGTSVAEIQEQLLHDAGIEVSGVSAYSAKAIDVTDSILRMRDASPDVWITTGYIPDTNLLLRTSRDQGYRPPAIIITGTGDTSETNEALGDYLNGILVVNYPRYDTAESFAPGVGDYVAAYEAKFGTPPIAPQSLNAYVGFKILAEAVTAAASTAPDAVRAAALAIDKPMGSYETGFGVKFDDTMQNTRAFPTVGQWQDGSVKTVFPVEAANTETSIQSLSGN
nr:ABC transporter substrate-binding protein [uncultured Devosia sp.]